MKMVEKLCSVNETSEKYGMSKAFWRSAIFNKEIEVVRIGRAVRLTESAIKNYLNSIAVISKPA